jgi:gluconate 2-dehydrogenase gamma chain
MGSQGMKLRRRTLLGAGLSAVAVSCGGPKAGSSWRYFTEEEARTVEAITEQLIPSDDAPGAKEALVVRYIDVQLCTHFKKHRKAYRDGLAAVDAASRKAGKPFVELADAQKLEVLNSIEENNKAFFSLILAHTRQGFYGDPRHGGNRGQTSWKMLGLATPPVRGRLKATV